MDRAYNGSLIASIFLAFLLSACAASGGEYWQQSMTRSLVQSVERRAAEDMPSACGKRHGCAVRMGWRTWIYIIEGLPPAFDACVETHERKHADGWRHPPERTKYLDCGDGTHYYPNGKRAIIADLNPGEK